MNIHNTSFLEKSEVTESEFNVLLEKGIITEKYTLRNLQAYKATIDSKLEKAIKNPFKKGGVEGAKATAYGALEELHHINVMGKDKIGNLIKSQFLVKFNMDGLLEKGYGGKVAADGETRIWGGKTYIKDGKKWKFQGDSKAPEGTNEEKAQYHREQMAIAQEKHEGHKFHYHMGKRDMYKELAKKEQKQSFDRAPTKKELVIKLNHANDQLQSAENYLRELSLNDEDATQYDISNANEWQKEVDGLELELMNLKKK